MFWNKKEEVPRRIVKEYQNADGKCSIEFTFTMKSKEDIRIVAQVDFEETSSFVNSILKQVCGENSRWFVFEANKEPIDYRVIAISQIESVVIKHIPFLVHYFADNRKVVDEKI